MARPNVQMKMLGHERRAFARDQVAISARLELPSGGRTVLIVDLTDRGARLQLDRPPPAGAPAVLKWESRVCYATVIWSEEQACGLQFEQILPKAVVAEVTPQEAPRIKPVAALDKIRIGARRGDGRSRVPVLGALEPGSYAWSVVLRRPGGSTTQRLSAAEEMFFYGAPNAHLVSYEQRFR